MPVKNRFGFLLISIVILTFCLVTACGNNDAGSEKKAETKAAATTESKAVDTKDQKETDKEKKAADAKPEVKPVPAPADEPTKAPAQQPADAADKKTDDAPAQQPADAADKKTADAPAQQPADAADKKTADAPAPQPADATAKTTADTVDKKPVNEAVKATEETTSSTTKDDAAGKTDAAEKPKNDKAAEVNGVAIPMSAYEQEVGRMQQELMMRGQLTAGVDLSALNKAALENLIGRELLYQDSQAKGVKIEDTEIDEKIKDLIGRYENEQAFEAELKQVGITREDLRNEFRRNLAVSTYLEKEFVSKAIIPDDEVKQYYENNKGQFVKPEEVKTSHILIMAPEDGDEAKKKEARQKIEEVLKKAKQGDDFAELAKQYSEGPSKTKGGDLGFLKRGQTVKPFEEVAFSLKPGEVSEVVETRFGYHVIKVFEKNPEEVIPFEEISERLGEYLKQKKIGELISAHVIELKNNADIKYFVENKS